jgi:ribosomal protein S27AE
MTYPKIKPCPKCGGHVSLYTYESGWSRTECDKCDHISSCEGSKLRAIRKHNAKESQPVSQT